MRPSAGAGRRAGVGVGILAFLVNIATLDAAEPLVLSGRVSGNEPGRDVWIGVFGKDTTMGEWSAVANGRFEVRPPTEEATTLVVCSKGKVPVVVDVSHVMETDGLDIRLSSGLRLNGVVKSTDGRALPGATIVVQPSDGLGFDVPPTAEPGTQAASGGAFLIEGLAAGRHKVEVQALGHLPLVLDDVVVTPDDSTPVELELEQAFYATGRVLDRRGTPVAGATVVAKWRGSSTTTSEDGSYQLGPFESGARLNIFAMSAEAGSSLWHDVWVPQADYDLELLRHAVRGRVVDDNGRPVERFQIAAYVGETRRSSEWITDEDGWFHLPVETATNSMIVDAPGRFPHLERLRIVTEGDTDLGDITLAAERSVRGRVVDKQTGTPVAGAFVSLRPPHKDPLYAVAMSASIHGAKTDGDGLFVLDGMPVGVFRAAAGAHGYARKYVEVPSDSAWIDFELDTGATIAGAVVLPDGRPVPSDMLVIYMTGGGGWGDRLPDGVPH